MPGKVKLETLTLAQVVDGSVYGQWDNPYELAVPTVEKSAALQSNPYRSTVEVPAQVVAVLDGVIIGNMDMFEGKIYINGAPTPMMWGSNLFVHADFRHVGAGLGLLMQMQRSFPIVGVVGVSKMIHGVYQGLKWTEHILPRMVHVSRSRPVLRSMVKNDVLATLGAPFIDLGLGAQRALAQFKTRRDMSGMKVEVTKSVPDDMARILTLDCPTHLDRTPQRVQWLLDNQFDSNPTRKSALLVFRDQGAVAGFSLVKQRHFEKATQREIKDIDLASVVDWGVASGSHLTEAAIIQRSVREAVRWGAHIVEAPTASVALRNELAQLGMRPVGELNVFFKSAKGHEFSVDEACAHHLRGSDGDNYFA